MNRTLVGKEAINTALNDGLIEQLISIGATNEQIARSIGVSIRTYQYWLKEQPLHILQKLQRARRPVIEKAFEGLVRLSQGYHEPVVKKHIRNVYDADGKVVSKVEEITQDDVYVEPSHQACTKVIVNYLNQTRKGGGIPDEYISEPINNAQDQRTGKLSEMDRALEELFFGKKDDE